MKLELPQPFEELDHTADVGVVVRGEGPEETLARLVLAMSELLSGGGPVDAAAQETIEVEPGDRVTMALDVLRELLFRFDTEHLIATSCRVERFAAGGGARVELELGPYDERRHADGAGIKAVTLHDARFEQDRDGWLAQVVFDV